LRDQSIINILHRHREEYGYTGPSPVMELPCRWAVFPTTEWQPHWNSPEMWLPEVRKKRRYPGIVSRGRLEIYCPADVDMLSSWAYIPISDKRQERIRLYAHHEGLKKTRYCSDTRPGVGDALCCKCGESAALVHMPGDLKRWPAVQNLLLAYMPPFRERPADDAFAGASSTDWWGGDARAKRIHSQTYQEAILTAKALGLVAVFDSCATMNTRPRFGSTRLSYHKVEISGLELPLSLEFETTAPSDAFVLIGPGGHSGFELNMGTSTGQATMLRWVRSSGDWAAQGYLYSLPISAQETMKESLGLSWASFTVMLSDTGDFEVKHPHSSLQGVHWGLPLPEDLFSILRREKITVSVGTLTDEARWSVCRK